MPGFRQLLIAALLCCAGPVRAAEPPDCGRPYTLALHDHGLLYSANTGEGIDKDVADELIRRSGCKVNVSLMPRARIWQLIESGVLDFSLSGISNPERERFAAFAWYFSNPYALLLRKDSGARSVAEVLANPALRLGAIRGFRYGPSANLFADAMAAQGRISHATQQLEALFDVLLDNRVQVMIVEPFDSPTTASARIRELTVLLPFDDPSIPHGLIMSRKALAPSQQLAWAALIDAMRADGTVQRIFEKYFPVEQARALTRF